MDLAEVPAHTRAGLAVMNAGKVLAEPGQWQGILDRYLAHEKIEDIAASLNLSASAVYHYLIRQCEGQWKDYQAARALAQYDEAENALREATDGVQVSQARELLRSQQWRLERVLRRIYGADAPTINLQVNVGDVGGQIAQLEAELLSVRRTIEGESSPTSDNTG